MNADELSQNHRCITHQWVTEKRRYWVGRLGGCVVCRDCGLHGIPTKDDCIIEVEFREIEQRDPIR